MKALKLTIPVLAIVGLIGALSHARITGTNPTGSSADVVCFGPKSYEVCVDYLGDVIPTTTATQALGTSSLRFSNIYTTLLNVSGATTFAGAISGMTSILGPVPTTQVMTTGGTITADACGGLKRITSTAAVALGTNNNLLTAASSTYKGCIMSIMNVGTYFITVGSSNGQLYTNGNASALIGTYSNFQVVSDGSAWYQIGTFNSH